MSVCTFLLPQSLFWDDNGRKYKKMVKWTVTPKGERSHNSEGWEIFWGNLWKIIEKFIKEYE